MVSAECCGKKLANFSIC